MKIRCTSPWQSGQEKPAPQKLWKRVSKPPPPTSDRSLTGIKNSVLFFFCSVFLLFSKCGAQKPYEIFGQVVVSLHIQPEKQYSPILKSLSSPFSVFFQTTREFKQCHLIEGIESDHLANTEQLEQIARIQTVNWVRFTFAFIAENSTVVPKPFMHRRKEMPSNTLFSREHYWHLF